MKTLFERVFNGSDEMFAKAEEEVNKIVAEVGRDAPLTLPSTAYFCACIYAYIGKKVTTTGELQDALADVKAMMLREPRTHSIFQSGVGTAIAAEMIEACKYVKTQTPYEGTNYHGHFQGTCTVSPLESLSMVPSPAGRRRLPLVRSFPQAEAAS